ncbi:hypothetical protein [Dactylosporangium sp. CS-033363]|uniref:hypothetical protein n=1 Tax=Dactylosporangium sp. CS-033363 TaxID=3239935 RepID=UPI003D945C19
MSPFSGPRISLDLRCDTTAGDLGPVLTTWFERSLHDIAAPLHERLLARTAEPADVPVARGVFGGPPGEVWAGLCSENLGYVAYSTGRYAQFRRDVAAGVDNLRLDIGSVAPLILPPEMLEAGIDWPVTYELQPDRLTLTFIRDDDGTGWFTLDVDPKLIAPGSAGAAALSTMIAAAADQFPIITGHAHLNMPDLDESARGEQRLWIAFVDAETGDRFGGHAALAATGLFTGIERSAHGGYILKTSPHAQDLLTKPGDRGAFRWWASLGRPVEGS